MKTSNVSPWHPAGIISGHVGRRAGTPGVTWIDAASNESTEPVIRVIGATVIDGDGYTSLVIDSLPWFNVVTYGAVGDGATDSTVAINLAIAALILAGRGVLYFPTGTYVVSSALTTITVPCTVMGDGMYGVSVITMTSQTAVLFTTSHSGANFRDLELANIYAGTASAGAAIVATNATLNNYDRLYIHDFYTGVDLEDSVVWKMTACHIGDVHKYGLRIRNTASPDAGDWFISDSWFGTTHAADAGIRIETSGGGKIDNCKINGSTGSNNFTYGIDLAVTHGTSTAILLMSNLSIENVNTHGFRGTTGAATSAWGDISFVNCQFTILGNSGKAISLVGTTAGDFFNISIVGVTAGTAGTARSAIQLTNCDNVTLSAITLQGFNAFYSSTTSTNIHDLTSAGTSVTGASKITTPGDIDIHTFTSFTDLDATNAGITVTTGAHHVLIGFTATGSIGTVGDFIECDLDIDGTRQGQTFGLMVANQSTASGPNNLSFTFMTPSALSAASHTFKVQMKINNGSHAFVVYASTGVTPLTFWVQEMAF